MFTSSIDITASEVGLVSMTEVLKDRLFGPTENWTVLGSGLQNNQTTLMTKTVCILLVLSMVTLGMMCHAINATILLVFQVYVPPYFS